MHVRPPSRPGPGAGIHAAGAPTLRPWPFRTALLLLAAPAVVLLVLVASGELDWFAGLLALLALAVVAGAASLLWRRDVERLTLALRNEDAPPPLLPNAALLAREARRTAVDSSVRETALTRVAQAEQSLVRVLPDPVLVLGAGGAIRRCNPAAEATFGPEMPAVLRHPVLRAAIDRAQAEGRTHTVDLSLPVPVAREIRATIVPLDPPLVDGGRLVAVLSDRTRERAVERMRADFVANASHELRTPLASLIGFIDTLRGPAADDPPAQARFLGIMAEQAQRMNRLIDDLLSLSRIEMVEHQPPADPVEIGSLIHRMADFFEPRTRARRQTLQLQVQDGLPPVTGDEDQLEQVLQNLVDNAVKYGREGGVVRVAVAPSRGRTGRPGVALIVADDGQGIARAHIPRLTERFYRADKHRSRAVGGTGLGLAIVKHIVSRHRGQMTIESTEGEGTSVTVWLPAADSGAAGTA